MPECVECKHEWRDHVFVADQEEGIPTTGTWHCPAEGCPCHGTWDLAVSPPKAVIRDA